MQPPAPASFEEQIAVQTPEHMALAFDVAGIGSRAIAYLIDYLIRFIAMLLIVFILERLAPLDDWLPRSLLEFKFIIQLAIVFAVVFLYMPIFEAAWEGQTPGKRLCGIRAIRDDGSPVTFIDAVLRNVMRIVDFLPMFYGLGIFVMFLNREAKRVGDYAAGTMVVKEREISLDQYLQRQGSPADAAATADTPDEAAVTSPALAPEGYEIVSRFLDRRGDFDQDTRAALAERLAAPYRERQELAPLAAATPDDEAFLAALVARGSTGVLASHDQTTPGGARLTAPQTLDRFVASRRSRWERLGRELEALGNRGLKSLTHGQIMRLGSLYRATSADHALAQTYYPASAVAAYLNRLVASAHNRIYRRPGWTWRTLLDFYLVEVPQTFQAYQRYFWISAAAFFGCALGAFSLVLYAPAFAELVISPRLLDMIERQEMWTEDLWLNAPTAAVSVQILSNNIFVTAMTFATGIFFGAGTLYYLGLNGFLLGAVSALTWRHGMARDFWDFVTPHGVIEISMILVGGMGGLILGNCLLAPGRYMRRDALRLHGRPAVRLMLASIPVLILAGWIEGNFSSAPFPFWLKQAFGILLGVVLFSYLLGHSPRREDPWGPTEPPSDATTGPAP